MEEQTLYDATSLNTNAMVSGFICPSVTQPKKDDKRTCYLFSNGDAHATNNTGRHLRGVIAAGMGWNGTSDLMKKPYHRRAKDVVDGLSQTIFLAERCYGLAGSSSDVRFGMATSPSGPNNYDNCRNTVTGRQYNTASLSSDIANDWSSYLPGNCSFNSVFPPNGPTCGSSAFGDFAGGPTPTSLHPAGGVNTVFGDGSVRFISELINAGDSSYANWVNRGQRNDESTSSSPYGVWGALCTINGTETGMMSQIPQP